MNRTVCFLLFACCLLPVSEAVCARAPVSEATEECLGCHSTLHPGIVEDWQKSRHARIAPRDALKEKPIARRISATDIPDRLKYVSVGCAECHTLRVKNHADAFIHNEVEIHVVVSPQDCAVCHVTEASEYAENIMSHAVGNLADNPVFQDLQRTIIGSPVRTEGGIQYEDADAETRAEACYYCHGTRLVHKGMETRNTGMGEMAFPRIEGWPNQGVGRINLDGSRGSCAACHTRHGFSIEVARKPHTCGECHVGPDVPAYKVYSSSKHGNIYASINAGWDFDAVPWTIGKDFTAPTCGGCHMSLLVNTDGETVAQRSHKMNDRLAWRIFGLPFAHPHPRRPDTSIIKNREGLPLPTDFDGGIAAEFLIGPVEQETRTRTMQAVCLECHGKSWVDGHWKRFENTIGTTNRDILTATRLMEEIWSRGYAKGIAQQASPFDEAIERTWCDAWLFYANTVRFASAMAGGGDYGVFADGRYQLSRRIRELAEWLELRKKLFPPPPEPITRNGGQPAPGAADLQLAARRPAGPLNPTGPGF
ncbi:multiheme c-type cytochrome [Desulfococcus sp.]|uniref:multiheme c-type cytochrome n=1 Tax=Desulfococcus sp. TaxID=2025834 RepID=UPI0035942922